MSPTDILALGCQRVIFDTNYLKALHQPNLEINYDGITAISDTGILTQKGLHQAHLRHCTWHITMIDVQENISLWTF